MPLAINLRYLQARKNSRMRLKVQGCLMQARFFEINMIFAKRKWLDTFLTEWYISIYEYKVETDTEQISPDDRRK